MSPDQSTDEGITTQQLLQALLLVAIAEREERASPEGPRRRTEVLLNDAGFSLGNIAKMTGRPYESVKSTIRRAREKN